MEYLATIHPLLPPIAGALGLALGALITAFIINRIVLRAIRAVAKRSN